MKELSDLFTPKDRSRRHALRLCQVAGYGGLREISVLSEVAD
jgi:hypothetical protein